MIDLTEKSEKYAAGKAHAAFDKAIAQAYADGYRDGYKDCKEEILVNLNTSKTEYVDLGLPSGTLWGANYEKEGDKMIFLTYEKACSYNIPTVEQWIELQENCKRQNLFDNSNYLTDVLFVGPNGNKIKFEISGRFTTGGYTDVRQIFFWLREEKEGNEKPAVHMQKGGGYEYVFCGFRLPIRLVRKTKM